MKDKLHIITVFSIIFVLIIIAIIIDNLLQPKSFNEHGHFRWDAVNELLSQKVINQDINTCRECHQDIYQLHQKDAHYNVPCVDCHSAGNLHVSYHRHDADSKNITKEQAKLKKEFNFEGCLYCHRKLAARPTDFPQIDQKEHYKFMHVKDSNTKCIVCHSPHEPIFLLADSRQARVHPMVYKCTDCHTTKPEKNYYNVEDHPKIFECKDCHPDIVKDFETKPHHKYVECRTCHLFHKENETMGRMYKNGNAKFCLLCHESKPFKDSNYPPKIEWPSHIAKIKSISKLDTKICLDCHSRHIHKMELKLRGNPHAGNWKNVHAKFAKKTINGKEKMTCSNCHTKDYCFDCHKLDMPHPEEFLDNHKATVEKKGKKLCENCHSQEFCTQCH
ncbi:MAG: hypothetical protein V1779_02145 [bacterium]